MFGDYYYAANNHDGDIEGENGFWFRRIYLTGDNKLNDEFSVRLRLELNSPGDFHTRDKLTPYAKHAYIRWARGLHSIYFGISPTPTFELIDDVWGYRSVEKTALDLQRFRSSSDFGLTFKGAFDPQKKVNYTIMLANGNGNSSETDRGKMVLASLAFRSASGFIMEGYFDANDAANGRRSHTVQGFAGFESDSFRGGVLYARQTRRIGPVRGNMHLRILSVFASRELRPKTWIFLRLDRNFDPNPEGAKIDYLPFDPASASNFMVAGFDVNPIKDVHVMPNIELIAYDEESSGTDIMPRMTLFYNF